MSLRHAAAGEGHGTDGGKEPGVCFEPGPGDRFEPREIVIRCVESGARCILLDEGCLPPAFFDLSTGVAGELLHHLSKYGMRLAAVVSDPGAHSANFQAFLQEANRGRAYRFFPTRAGAVAWLHSA